MAFSFMSVSVTIESSLGWMHVDVGSLVIVSPLIITALVAITASIIVIFTTFRLVLS